MHNNEPIFSIGQKIDGFKLTNHIGSGGTAEVWEVEDDNLNKWALKIFSPTRVMDDYSIRLFKSEFLKTEKLVHPHILRARKYGEFQNRPYIIFDLCETSIMKELLDKIHAARILALKNNVLYSEDDLANLIYQVADALFFLHKNDIVHQDIKPDNILIKSSLDVRPIYMISDFGVSTDIKMTILRSSDILKESNKGLTPDYASPELYQGVVIPPTDIFALGITLYELCTGKPPISNTSMTTAIALLNNNGYIPDLPEDYSKRFDTLIKKCLQLHPEDRPTASDLVDWASFYLNEHFWPESISNNPDPDIKTKKINLKSVFQFIVSKFKQLAIIFGSIAIIVIIWFFLKNWGSHTESTLMSELEKFNIEAASVAFQNLDPTQKEKYSDLSYLSDVSLSRIEIVDGNNLIVVKSKTHGKLGLINNKGKILIPIEYDKIYKIFDVSVVTVQEDRNCSQYDLHTGAIIKKGICKIFKNRSEFIQEFSNK